MLFVRNIVSISVWDFWTSLVTWFGPNPFYIWPDKNVGFFKKSLNQSDLFYSCFWKAYTYNYASNVSSLNLKGGEEKEEEEEEKEGQELEQNEDMQRPEYVTHVIYILTCSTAGFPNFLDRDPYLF